MSNRQSVDRQNERDYVMTLRSTNPIVYNGTVEIALPNNGYDCAPVEALMLFEHTIEYIATLRALNGNPEIDHALVANKKERAEDGYTILLEILKRELGEDMALAIAVKIDFNLKMPDEKS